jgi:hypothetical protein
MPPNGADPHAVATPTTDYGRRGSARPPVKMRVVAGSSPETGAASTALAARWRFRWLRRFWNVDPLANDFDQCFQLRRRHLTIDRQRHVRRLPTANPLDR